ncbi:hypothetical protein [Kordiimonas sp.]|uniref:hypothetical protein n=1 Tax=Kordiimonas sp. TaxID=1970157 RepID=UPI003A8DF38E
MIGSLRTRLIDRALWYRYCGWFTFAHKPLCNHYKAGVLRIGPLAVCRSCTIVYVTMALAGIACALFSDSVATKTAQTALACLMVITILVSYPPLYRKLPRWGCDLARGSLGAIIAVTAAQLISAPQAPLPLINAGVLVIIWFTFGAIRQKAKRGKCNTCPEYREGHICSGYAQQSVNVRKYEEAMAAYFTQQRLKKRP